MRKFNFYTVLGSSSRKYVSCPPIALCFKWWYFCPSWILIMDKCEKGVWVCCLLRPPNKYLTHWSPDSLFNYWQLLGSQRFLIKWHYQEILLKCKLLAACLNFLFKPMAINYQLTLGVRKWGLATAANIRKILPNSMTLASDMARSWFLYLQALGKIPALQAKWTNTRKDLGTGPTA